MYRDLRNSEEHLSAWLGMIGWVVRKGFINKLTLKSFGDYEQFSGGQVTFQTEGAKHAETNRQERGLRESQAFLVLFVYLCGFTILSGIYLVSFLFCLNNFVF